MKEQQEGRGGGVGVIEEEGVIPGRIWLSLWGELHCNPLLSMQTWAGFHQILIVTESHRG